MNAQLRSVATDVRTLPRAAWFLFLGTFINRFGSFVVPFLVLYLTAQGYSATRAGAAVSSYGVGHIAASALGGYLTDRLGRRTTIVISMFSSALSMLALSQAREYYSIIVLTFLAGMTAELYRPASSALLADLVPSERRLVGYAMYRFAVNAGYAAGPAVAGLLARRSFQLLFFGDAITSLIYGIIAMSFLPAGVRAVRSASGWGVALRTAWKSTPLVLFLVSSFLLAIVQFQILTTIPLQVSAFGHSPAVYGALMSVNGVLIILLEVGLTAVTRRYRPNRTIALGYFLLGVGVALTGASAAIPFLILTVVIWTIGEMIFAPTTSAFMAEIAPEDLRGRYMAMLSGTWSVGMTVGPALGSFLFDRSPALHWSICFLVAAAAAALVWFEPRPSSR